MQTLRVFAACAGLAAGASAKAQELGDANMGLRYAERNCVECHAVTPGETLSPNLDAPPFVAVANTPGMTATALAVWFRTPHPTMPNLLIEGEDKDNIIAYILSLKRKD